MTRPYSCPDNFSASVLSMKVEVWSDIICPWCGLGLHRLDAALARFAHRDEVEVVHHSFQLDPTTLIGEETPVREMLARKFRMGDAESTARQIEGMTRRVEDMARSEGLHPYNALDNTTGNTGPAHELLAYASTQGLHGEAWRRIYQAYFGERRSVFGREPLLDFAEELGLDRDEAGAALDTGAFRQQVRDDHREAQQLGANGVPFFVIDRPYGIAGAQPADDLLSVLQEAWHEGHPLAMAVSGEDGADFLCGPNGCAPTAANAGATTGV